MLKRHPLTLAIVFSSLALVACNSNDDDNVALPSKAVTTTTITVSPSLGKILNGRVALKNATTGATLAATKTLTPSDNGIAKFTVPVSVLADPILAEVLPTAAGILEYADEALEKAATITVAAADANKPILRAAASVTPSANIGVTALTEAAVQQAVKLAGTTNLTTQQINNANTAVKTALKLDFDITQAPIVVGVGEFSKLVDAALDAQRRAYAAYLATLAKEAKRINSTSTMPAYDMAKVFASDLSDGTFDAKQGTTVLSFYNSNFINAWVNWVQNFYTSFAQLSNIVALNRWYSGFDITNKESVKTYPDATPIRTVDGVEEYACSGEGRIKSSQSDGISMDFINQRGSNVSIYWLNYSAARVSYKNNLATGQTHAQGTFVTHPWLVTDNKGACIGIYRPVTATKKTITFKASEVVIGNQSTQPVTETCVSKKLPVATLTSIADYNGDYKEAAAVIFNLNTQMAKASIKGIDANITEVCGPNNHSNGTNHVLITDKGNITLFKTKTDVYSADGFEFSDKTKVFYGEKSAIASTNNCSSNGTDDILGFTNAPDDFCGFTSATSTFLSSSNLYTFLAADGKTNTKITTTDNGSVLSVLVENDKYSFACGLGSPVASCSNTVSTEVSATQKRFTFTDTTLSTLTGAQGIMIGSGSLTHVVSASSTGTTSNNAVCTPFLGNYINCGASVIADFAPVTLKQNGVPTQSCVVSKTGSMLSITIGNATLTATLDGAIGDSLTAIVNEPSRDTMVIATGAGFDTGIGAKVSIDFKDNQVVSALGQKIGSGPLSCVK